MESIILNQLDRVREVADQIKERGYVTSLDDFGSGYSSYSVLSEAAFDIIKIDRSMFLNEQNEKEAIAIRHMIDMAHEMGMKVVAEGIETKGYVTYLKSIGCDYVQGFACYRPMTIASFEEQFLKQDKTIVF